MIEIVRQDIRDYMAGARIAGLSIVNSYGSEFLMYHPNRSSKPIWSVVFDETKPSHWVNHERATREEFIDFVMSSTPELADWLLFNICDIDSGEIFNVE